MPLGLDLSRRDKRLPTLSGLGDLAFAVVLICATYALVRLLAIVPRAFTLLDQTIANKNDFATLCSVLAFAVGIGLYVLRLRKRGLYAIGELGFAFATAWFSVMRLHSQGDTAVWFGFAGAAYLVVRGLDNLATARERREWPWTVGLISPRTDAIATQPSDQHTATDDPARTA